MNKNRGLLKKGAELLVFGAMASVFIAGCGGGGGGNTGTSVAVPSASSTALGSYITEGQGTSFNGTWFVSSAASSTASADTRTLAATTSPTVFTITYTPKQLANGSWSNVALAPGANYDLTPTGWALGSQVGQTLVDSGDGTNAVLKMQNGATTPVSIAKTNLQGTLVGCLSSTGSCASTTPIYPAGASKYSITQTSDTYLLFSPSNNNLQVTDQSGNALTALPTAGGTFCDPILSLVYQQISPAFNSYNVYFTAGCTSGAISTALGTTRTATVMISVQATNNVVVPGVLLLSGWTGTYSAFATQFIYGLRAGYVWLGVMEPLGTTNTLENKIAINAELVDNGFVAIP